MRSFSRSPYIIRLLYTYRKCSIFLMLRLATRQSYARQLYLQLTRFKFASFDVFCVFFPLLVGGRIALYIVDGFFGLRVFFPLAGWMAGQLINAVGSYSVGFPRSLFLSICVSCLIHGTIMEKNMAHELSSCSCYSTFFLLIPLCGGRHCFFYQPTCT